MEDSVVATVHALRRHEVDRCSNVNSCSKYEDDLASKEANGSVASSPLFPSTHSNGAWMQRRLAVAREIKNDREHRVWHLHEIKSRHFVDHCFSFTMGNFAIVSFVLGAVYHERVCDKPLAAFLIVLGCLAPFAACVPILVRQWFYLHLRCNALAVGVFFMGLLFVTWLMIGQRWAFETSAATCDDELSTASNAVIFVMFIATLVYSAKVAWYLLLRARYSHCTLWRSCWKDPYPNALEVSADEFLALEAIVVAGSS